MLKYKLRAFCKDTESIQDIKDYKISGKDISMVSDFKNKEYLLEDTEYVIIYKDTLKEILDVVYKNGKNSNQYNAKKSKESLDINK